MPHQAVNAPPSLRQVVLEGFANAPVDDNVHVLSANLGSVIGPEGATVRGLRVLTGAQIHIPNYRGKGQKPPEWNPISVQGPEKARTEAKRLLLLHAKRLES